MCSLLFASQIEIPGNVTKVDVADDLEWPFAGHVRYCKWFYCLYVKYTACTMYQVNYNRRLSYMSNHFCCCIRLEGLLCDAEHDLLAVAKFLIVTAVKMLLIIYITEKCLKLSWHCLYLFVQNCGLLNCS